MKQCVLLLGVLGAFLLSQSAKHSLAEEKPPTDAAAKAAQEKAEAIDEIKKDTPEAVYALKQEAAKGISSATNKGDAAWMLISTALVMLMVPGLALFYCGMVRRKNVLATMMHSMAALSVVGVFWFGIGYSLAFGQPWIGKDFERGSFLGFSRDLIFLQGIQPNTYLPNTTIPVYLHMLFQGMFAIITPALISGALAERIRFKPYLIFILAWVLFVYCPLAHCVWAMNWWDTTDAGTKMVGFLGKMDALDFAGGTVVHIAAGFSSLACIVVLRKRLGYPEHAIHPNSMVLTLTGAGILWFGWFGFNGGSALASGELATSAFAATQVAAAAAGLTWMLVEWIHRGKPTALGLASGIVAGLVAVTPASGYVFPWGGFIIGLVAGVVCYLSVNLKSVFKYDDSLDAFGVHGVGGFLGAVMTGLFCTKAVNSAGQNGVFLGGGGDGPKFEQFTIQFIAAALSAVVAFLASLVIVKVVDVLCGGFATSDRDEIDGLDRTEHGETGFDFGLTPEAAIGGAEPRAASVPALSGKRFEVVIEGSAPDQILQTWSSMWQPNKQVPAEFKAVYPFMTTVQGNRFHFSGGDPNAMRDHLQRLFQESLKTPIKARVE